MTIKSFRPMTSGTRGLVRVYDNRAETTNKPLKSAVRKLKSSGGRNNQGRTTIRFRGGGHKRQYRIVDFCRSLKAGVTGRVEAIEYDPNRTAYLARILYIDGARHYILAPDGLNVGDSVSSGANADISVGNALLLDHIPTGTMVHNIELKPGAGGQMARSAGTFAQIVAKEGTYASLKLPSGEVRKVHLACMATVGQVGNTEFNTGNFAKAGRMRWFGRRPHVRGVVMNPVDHPHGGGEGKTSGGRNPVSPWCTPAKGYRTRRNKRTSKYILKRRKK